MNESYNYARRQLIAQVRAHEAGTTVVGAVQLELLRTWALVVLALKESA